MKENKKDGKMSQNEKEFCRREVQECLSPESSKEKKAKKERNSGRKELGVERKKKEREKTKKKLLERGDGDGEVDESCTNGVGLRFSHTGLKGGLFFIRVNLEKSRVDKGTKFRGRHLKTAEESVSPA